MGTERTADGGRLDALPAALRLLRESRRLAQREVAARLGVEASVVGGWERGRRPPSAARLFQLATLYDLDLGDLDDALELAGALGERRRPAAGEPPIDPHRLARRLLGGRPRPPADAAEDALARLLGAVFALVGVLGE
jgi:transcriptional regulator with XRE-family HTH domain